MKVTIDQEKCISCNLCEVVSENTISVYFGIDNKAGINPGIDTSNPTTIEAVKLAEASCPGQAISIEE